MNSIVCLKEVPDTETRIEVRDGKVVEEGIQYVVNPYDEFALEEALKWQEAHGGKVTLVSLGPERARESILKGLAMGADEVYHLSDEAFLGGDAYATAKALAAAISKLGEYDVIFCGKQAVDDDNAAVGIMLAEMLDLPHVSVVSKLEIAEDGKSRPGRAGHRGRQGGGRTAAAGGHHRPEGAERAALPVVPRHPPGAQQALHPVDAWPMWAWRPARWALPAPSWRSSRCCRHRSGPRSHRRWRAGRSGQRGRAPAARRSKGHLGGESWETTFWSLRNSETAS